MDFTDAPTAGRKRRQVNVADNQDAMNRVREALVALGIPRDEIVIKVFMQGQWKVNRSCELHRSLPWTSTHTQWNNLPANKRITRKLLIRFQQEF